MEKGCVSREPGVRCPGPAGGSSPVSDLIDGAPHAVSEQRPRCCCFPSQFPLAGPLHSHVASCPRQLCGQGPPPGCAPSPEEARVRGRGRKHDANRQRQTWSQKQPEKKKRASRGANRVATECCPRWAGVASGVQREGPAWGPPGRRRASQREEDHQGCYNKRQIQEACI